VAPPWLWPWCKRSFARHFGSDLLAGISIVTSAVLGEFLAGSIVVLMLSGGTALEEYAIRRASSVLGALAKRMPRVAHRKESDRLSDIDVSEIQVGEQLVVFPHETCPADGVVLEGRGSHHFRLQFAYRFKIRKNHEGDAGGRGESASDAPYRPRRLSRAVGFVWRVAKNPREILVHAYDTVVNVG
jgi:hypothetical protein